MTAFVLAKQPQIVFVLLELMSGRLRELLGRWKSIAIVVLPGVILSPLWVVGLSGCSGVACPRGTRLSSRAV